ncbi:nucleolin [Austrofundulus limnaeus]|uniref:Nucleolin n=1 Tax=Austrofundulus limnaeus TaxID=52670 RepID=A0A2I4CH24_AUSLI|nr:PREDICTED: nucleolin-like [Austrofundulus limnaeus]
MEKTDVNKIAKHRKGKKMKAVKGEDGSSNTVCKKRKGKPGTETCQSKKTKLINNGFCLYLGNLNNWKTVQEITDSLAVFFIKHSLLCQDIHLAPSRKHGFVNMASEMDMNKALTLNGEHVLDKPIKINKAKVKNDDKKETCPAVDKKDKDDRCLFLKNVPYDTSVEDIKKVFSNAVAVRFPGGAKGPDKGIAFVEFKNKEIAQKALEKKKGAQIHSRKLIVHIVRERKVPKDPAGRKKTKVGRPNKILFVSNLPNEVREKQLQKVFQEAVQIRLLEAKDKPHRFAFVEFATVEDAEKALQSSKNIKICNNVAKVDFCRNKPKPGSDKVSSKTLFVMGLAAKTTAETLKSVFEGAVDAKIAKCKPTGVSRRFGFVSFESEESCKAAKDAMEDCEIDGSKVTVRFSRSKVGLQSTGAGSAATQRNTGRKR